MRRTARVADGSSFCFNCRLHWAVQPAAHPHGLHGMVAPPPPPQPFGLAEQARLAMYRAAVRAGFYTDGPASSAVRS
jgi:hypothetical protein